MDLSPRPTHKSVMLTSEELNRMKAGGSLIDMSKNNEMFSKSPKIGRKKAPTKRTSSLSQSVFSKFGGNGGLDKS